LIGINFVHIFKFKQRNARLRKQGKERIKNEKNLASQDILQYLIK